MMSPSRPRRHRRLPAAGPGVPAGRVNRRGGLRVSTTEARRKRDAEPPRLPGASQFGTGGILPGPRVS